MENHSLILSNPSAGNDAFCMAVDNADASTKIIAIASTRAEAANLLEKYETSTYTRFVGRRTRGSFCKNEPDLDSQLKLQVRWRHDEAACDDGVPFIVLGSKQFDCKNGPDYNAKKKITIGDITADHPEFHKGRQLSKISTKKDCSATLLFKEVLRFPSCRVNTDHPQLLAKQKETLKLINSNKAKFIEEGEKSIYIFMPSLNTHQNHPIGEKAGLTQCIDKRVKEKIYELINAHPFLSVQDVQQQIQLYVKNELKVDINEVQSRRFNPLTKDIANHVYLAKLARRNSTTDTAQENYEDLALECRELLERVKNKTYSTELLSLQKLKHDLQHWIKEFTTAALNNNELIPLPDQVFSTEEIS